jgi:MoxR-like ATPase
MVTIADLRAVALPVLRHRLVPSFHAASTGVTTDTVIERLMEELPERRPGDEMAPDLRAALA